MRGNGQILLEPVLVSTREPFRLFWRVNGPKVALSQVFCCVQANSVLKLLLSPLLTHKMPLQNYEENIKWNLAGRTIHNNFCFFFESQLENLKKLANSFQSSSILAIRIYTNDINSCNWCNNTVFDNKTRSFIFGFSLMRRQVLPLLFKEVL